LCCNNIGKIYAGEKSIGDSLYAKCVSVDSFISIDIINASEDTLYLFNSYLHDSYTASKFLHKVDVQDSIYKISFLPILPYLGVKTSDVINLSENKISTPFQILYDFIVLPPQTYYEAKIRLATLFKHLNEKENAVTDYNAYSLNKYDRKTKFSFVTVSSLIGYQIKVEFAYYKNVSLLCNQNAYYTNEFDFNKQAKSFKILSLPITIKK